MSEHTYRKPGDPSPPGEIEIDPQRPIVTPSNRWAEFSIEELARLKHAMADRLEDYEHPLFGELEAELERRRYTP